MYPPSLRSLFATALVEGRGRSSWAAGRLLEGETRRQRSSWTCVLQHLRSGGILPGAASDRLRLCTFAMERGVGASLVVARTVGILVLRFAHVIG